MKLIQIVTAYTALQALNDATLDAQSAYNVYRLKNALRESVNYFVAEETKLAGKYAKQKDGALEIRDGRIFFAGETDEERMANAEAYNRERAMLCAVDADGVKFAKASIHVPAGFRLTPAFFEALEGFAVVAVDGAEL